MNNTWKKLLTPEILFLIGTLQALLPYLFWQFEWGQNLISAYSFTINYEPLAVWVTGYIAFWLGCMMIGVLHFLSKKSAKKIFRAHFFIYPIRLRVSLILLILLIIIQVIFVIKLHDVVPIFAFFSGFYDVGIVNEQQLSSGFGQLGILMLSSFALNALVMSAYINEYELHRIDKYLLFVSIFLIIFTSIFQGKRQGLFICFSFIMTGIALVKGRSIFPKGKIFYLKKSIIKQIFLLSVSVLSLLLIFGFMRSIRSGSFEGYNFQKSIDEAAFYLSLPLVNMHEEVSTAGWLGFQFNPKALLFGLLPYKFREQSEDAYIDQPMPVLERSSGAGFLGGVHWAVGLGGMIVFCILTGALCKFIYLRSTDSFFYLLVYCQAVWTLVAAHTYNHFITLMFFPAPVLVYFVLAKILVQKPLLPIRKL